MGVYIKGMEMPKDCDSCWHPNCALWIGTDVGNRHVDCPLVSVPAHGDLIDREELQHIIGQFSLNWEYGQGVSDCWDALLAAPTVIPAAKEGET